MWKINSSFHFAKSHENVHHPGKTSLTRSKKAKFSLFNVCVFSLLCTISLSRFSLWRESSEKWFFHQQRMIAKNRHLQEIQVKTFAGEDSTSTSHRHLSFHAAIFLSVVNFPRVACASFYRKRFHLSVDVWVVPALNLYCNNRRRCWEHIFIVCVWKWKFSIENEGENSFPIASRFSFSISR